MATKRRRQKQLSHHSKRPKTRHHFHQDFATGSDDTVFCIGITYWVDVEEARIDQLRLLGEEGGPGPEQPQPPWFSQEDFDLLLQNLRSVSYMQYCMYSKVIHKH